MIWEQTYTGVQFWPLNPRVEDVRMEDIAHALSLKCRFGGHCRTFYSVAQHSILVARAMQAAGYSNMTCQVALLHDAAEAYLPDVCRPLKPTWKNFQAIEDHLLEVIFTAFHVITTDVIKPIVKLYDDVLLATEARDLMGPPPAPWEKLPNPLVSVITPISFKEAKHEWFQTWHELKLMEIDND